MTADAACRDADTNLFYPDGSEFRGGRYEAESKRVVHEYCRVCPVREECEGEYRKHPGQPGIWAGLTEAERVRNPPRSCRSCGGPVDPKHNHQRCKSCRQS